MAADDAPLLEVAAHCRSRLVVEAIGEPPDVLLEGCPRGRSGTSRTCAHVLA